MFQSGSWDFMKRINDGIDNNSASGDLEMRDLDQYEGIDRLYLLEDAGVPPRGGYEVVRVDYSWYLSPKD